MSNRMPAQLPGNPSFGSASTSAGSQRDAGAMATIVLAVETRAQTLTALLPHLQGESLRNARADLAQLLGLGDNVSWSGKH